jgi:hypothetical protein
MKEHAFFTMKNATSLPHEPNNKEKRQHAERTKEAGMVAHA